MSADRVAKAAKAAKVVVLGIFVADTTYRASRLPRMGETLLGSSNSLGPGGKGSNQAVAAGKACAKDFGGVEVHFISRIGDDAFADMGERLWTDSGVTSAAPRDPKLSTGAAFVFIEQGSGDNAIIVSPGAAGTLSAADLEEQRPLIQAASVFVTQLEQPLDAARRGLEIAHEAGVTTILNPAPAPTSAAPLDDALLALCDYLTPNETETEALTGLPVTTVEEAEVAGRALLSRGVKNVLITLGEQGVLLVNEQAATLIPAFKLGEVVETTGAGDAFNGGFAAALAEGQTQVEAARFGCATAGLSVTRAGAAASMPSRAEIEKVLS